MDDERLKRALVAAIEKSLDAHAVGEIVREFARGPRPTHPEAVPADGTPPTAGARRLLTRIVLGDILDDAILGARPQDRTFPLRLFFGELSRLLAIDADDGPLASTADAAFAVASGLNFFFRASMDGESKMRVGLAVSRQLYVLAHTAPLDADLVGKATPLLAALMTNELERLKFESVDHVKVFDSQLHERTAGADPSSFAIVRPASFLCVVASNGTVKAKAEVLT